MPSHPTTLSTSTSLLVRGGAHGTPGDYGFEELDTPIFGLTSASDDEPDPDEHPDR